MIGIRAALLLGSSLTLTGCGRIAYELVSPLLGSDAGEPSLDTESTPSNTTQPKSDTEPFSGSGTDVTPLTGAITGLDAGATFASTAPPTTDVDASLTETTDVASTNPNNTATSAPSSDDSPDTDSSSDASSSRTASGASSNNTDSAETTSNESQPTDATSGVATATNDGTSDAPSSTLVTDPSSTAAATSETSAPSSDTSTSSDVDSSSSGCAPGLFTAAVAVNALPPPAFSPSLSADGLTLYFASSGDVYSATRPDTDSIAFGGVAPVNTVNSGANELTPSLSRDGLRLYYARGDDPFRDLWVVSRATTGDAFGAPSPLNGLNSMNFTELLPREGPTGLEIFFSSLRGPSVFDVWVSRRNTLGDAYGSPALVAELNTNSDDNPGGLSSDGLTLMMASKRPGSIGAQDVWTATRPTTGSAFTSVINQTEINTTFNDLDPALSADDRELFFASDRTGQTLIYRALRCP